MANFFDLGGAVVPASVFEIPRAKWLVELLARDRLLYVQLVECRQRSNAKGAQEEIVVLDVEVERPQLLRYPILLVERVAVAFSPDDASCPEVLAIRSDFPRVPHLNIRPDEFPRSLCLYDHAWTEAILRWTPTTCIERIRNWLAETAKGTLHQADQPLEPLLFGNGYRLILPSDLFTVIGKEGAEALEVYLASVGEDSRVLIAQRPGAQQDGKVGLECQALSFAAKPQRHGIINHSPSKPSSTRWFFD